MQTWNQSMHSKFFLPIASLCTSILTSKNSCFRTNIHKPISRLSDQIELNTCIAYVNLVLHDVRIKKTRTRHSILLFICTTVCFLQNPQRYLQLPSFVPLTVKFFKCARLVQLHAVFLTSNALSSVFLDVVALLVR